MGAQRDARRSTLLAALVSGIASVGAPPATEPPHLWTFSGNVSLGTNFSNTTYVYSGWNDVVQRALVVARVDDATLRITLPSVGEMVDGQPAFDIWEDEVVRITLVPSSSARATRPPSARCADPAKRRRGAGRCSSRGQRGGAQNHSTARRVARAPAVLVLVLTADNFVPAVGGASANIGSSAASSRAATRAAAGTQSSRRARTPTRLVAEGASTSSAAYQIETPETIGVVVPRTTVESAHAARPPRSS